MGRGNPHDDMTDAQRIEHHFYFHGEDTSSLSEQMKQLNANITALISNLKQQETAMSAEMDRLTASVQRNTSVTDSALALISGLADQVRNAASSGDPAALNALADQIDAESQKLADAVTANTPAAPAATPAG